MFEQNITFSDLKKKLRWLCPSFFLPLLWKLTKGKVHSTCVKVFLQALYYNPMFWQVNIRNSQIPVWLILDSILITVEHLTASLPQVQMYKRQFPEVSDIKQLRVKNQ